MNELPVSPAFEPEYATPLEKIAALRTKPRKSIGGNACGLAPRGTAQTTEDAARASNPAPSIHRAVANAEGSVI